MQIPRLWREGERTKEASGSAGLKRRLSVVHSSEGSGKEHGSVKVLCSFAFHLSIANFLPENRKIIHRAIGTSRTTIRLGIEGVETLTMRWGC